MNGSAPREGPGQRQVTATTRARRRGRAIAIGLYYGLAALLMIVSTYQIARQVFWADPGGEPFASCREGLRALAAAVDRARAAASGTEGEDAALTRFRQALEPEWSQRDAVSRSCAGSDPDERALDAIERLRYAEEHAVRREAGDLAPLRRRVHTLVETHLGGDPQVSERPRPIAPR